MPRTRIDRERRRYSTSRLEHRLDPRDIRPPLADRQRILSSLEVREGASFEEFKREVILAFDDLVYQVNNALEKMTTFMDENGKTVPKGFAVNYFPDGYTITNLTTDRTYDANASSVAELADVLGTLITDLKEWGLIDAS